MIVEKGLFAESPVCLGRELGSPAEQCSADRDEMRKCGVERKCRCVVRELFMPVAWVAFEVRSKEKWIVNGDA